MRYLFIFLLLLALQGQAATYYFSNSTGDDTRSSATAQNKATPWKTANKITSLTDGDVAKFKAGETFSGTATIIKKITIDTFGTGSKPIISGMYSISTWTAVSGMPGVYESEALPISYNASMVMIGNTQYEMGRYPNADASNAGYLNYESYSKSVSSNPDTITDNTHQAGINSSFVGATVVLRYAHSSLAKATISTVSGTSNTQIGYTGVTPNITPSNGYGYFIQNDINTLDKFGEWYYNPTSKKLSVYFGSRTPASYAVQVATADKMFIIHANNIHFNNVALYGANYLFYSDWTISGFGINNCDLMYAGFDMIAFANMSNSSITNCYFNTANSCGIDYWYQDHALTFTNNTVRNIGIYKGSISTDLGGYYGIGLQINDTDSTNILNNDFHKLGFSGVRMNMASWVNINYNTMDSFVITLDDVGAVYTWASDGNTKNTHDRYVMHNIATHGLGASEGTPDNTDWGGAFYADDNSEDVVFSYNTAANNSIRGMFIHNSQRIVITYNTFYNNGISQLEFQHESHLQTRDCVIKNNKFFTINNSDLLISLRSINDDFTVMGTFDSNYYCRPLKESQAMSRNWFNNNTKLYDIVSTAGSATDWRTYISGDAHSVKTPITVTSTKQVVFTSAPGNSSNNVIYCKPVTSLSGQAIKGSSPVQAYSSDIMLSSTNILP